MQANQNEKMKELVYPTPNIVRLLVNFFVTLCQSDSTVAEKLMNFWAEICKLLPSDRQNVVLYKVII